MSTKRVDSTELNLHPGTLIKNAATSALGLAAGVLSGALFTPLMLHALGLSGYGVWVEGNSVTAYIGIIDIGVGTAIVTQMARRGKVVADVQRLVSTAFAICIGLCSVAVAATIALALAAPAIFSSDSSSHTFVIFLLLGLAQAAVFLALVATCTLQGSGRFPTIALPSMLLALAVSGGQVLLAELTHEPIWPAALALLGSIGLIILASYLARRKIPGFAVHRRSYDPGLRRALLRSGRQNATIYVAATIGFGSDVVIVGAMVNASAAVAYSVALSATQLLSSLATRVSGVVTPSYASLGQREESERVWTLFLRVTRLSLLIALPTGLALIVFANGLVKLWIGTVPAGTVPIVITLSVAAILQLPGFNAVTLLVGVGSAKELARISILSTTINIGLSVLFTLVLGSIGPAIGTLIAVAIFELLVMPSRAATVCGHKLGEFLRVGLNYMTPLAIEGGFTLLTVHLGYSTGWKVVLGSLGSCMVFWCVCLFDKPTRALAGEVLDIVRPQRKLGPNKVA